MKSPGARYHFLNRGLAQQRVFRDPNVYETFLEVGEIETIFSITIQDSYDSWRTRTTTGHVDVTEQSASRSLSSIILSPLTVIPDIFHRESRAQMLWSHGTPLPHLTNDSRL